MAIQTSQSHPSRVRGLNGSRMTAAYQQVNVAPFTGAWIERLSNYTIATFADMSHPSRVRGLNDAVEHAVILCRRQSHPSRVRGLNGMSKASLLLRKNSRTLHGCVD